MCKFHEINEISVKNYRLYEFIQVKYGFRIRCRACGAAFMPRGIFYPNLVISDPVLSCTIEL